MSFLYASVVIMISAFTPGLPKGRKKHINVFQHKLFCPPPKTPHFGPPEKSLCASFPGKERKNGTHLKTFSGGSLVKKGVPNGPFWATKVYCFFPPPAFLPVLDMRCLGKHNKQDSHGNGVCDQAQEVHTCLLIYSTQRKLQHKKGWASKGLVTYFHQWLDAFQAQLAETLAMHIMGRNNSREHKP